MADDAPGTTGTHTSAESAAAIRAYLQRCEVRLSTVHRVASALLSGAGLVVLFPALTKDSAARVVRALLEGAQDAPHRLVLAGIVLIGLVPVTALWLLLRDLTRFYFAGQHFETTSDTAFHPRFAISGLRISPDDIDASALVAIEDARHDPSVRAFLMAENAQARSHVDAQGRRYGLLAPDREPTDEERREALLELSATHTRTLAQQAARMEQVLARHILNLQLLVLRYAKAVMAMLTTSLAMFAAGSVIDDDPTTSLTTLLWLCAVILVWCPTIIFAVTAPVNWIMQISKADGASDRATKADREFTLFEDMTVRIAVVAWVLAFTAVVVMRSRDERAPHALAIAAASVLAIGVALARWDGKRSALRIFGLHERRSSDRLGA